MPTLDDMELASLSIVKYPDPVLAGPCRAVALPDDRLGALAERMFEIMYAARGVGLAAPQVGLAIRLFVANPTGVPGQDERVYLNPQIVDCQGDLVQEEGCLSCPGINSKIKRRAAVTLRAFDLAGQEFEQTGRGLLARIFQHEMDHLDGRLILKRMSTVARLANRRTIKDLEADYARQPERD
jgi:peptide deformylase